MSGKAGKNREDYRKNNRGHVLKLVATGECRNRTELTKAMGLSKMSISRIVSEMMGAGILAEEGTAGSDEPGRASSALGISPNAPLAAGLLIQREYCEALLCDLKMQILRREKIFFRQDMDNDKLMDVVYQVLDTLLYREERVIGIGVSSVGPISASEGMILKPLFFFDIQNVPIVKCLEQRYHLPVFLDHDNQCAAVCEFLYGVGRGFHDVLFLGVGTGLCVNFCTGSAGAFMMSCSLALVPASGAGSFPMASGTGTSADCRPRSVTSRLMSTGSPVPAEAGAAWRYTRGLPKS